MGKILTGGAVIILILLGFFYFYTGGSRVVYSIDTVQASVDVSRTDAVVLENGAHLEVTGDASIAGTIECKGGPIAITVGGTLTVSGNLRCNDGAISVVAKGPVVFEDSAEVVSTGSVQIVDDETKLAKSEADIEALFKETGEDTGTGTRIGPMIEGGKVGGTVSSASTGNFVSLPSLVSLLGVSVAEAQTARDKEGNAIPGVVISGTWTVGDGGNPPSGVEVQTPDKKIKKIVLNFAFGAGGNVEINNFHLVGPKGRSGESDEGKSCNAKGQDGEDAFRFRVRAHNITLNEFRLELGDGGDGGGAETTKNCDPGIARGGQGGEAGNFKMTADGEIRINSFHIVPGRGGSGGFATANGKDGDKACPGKKGGDATATGGNGGKNKKELAAGGAVAGIGNVTIDTVTGGFGGDATANPGRGGDGGACKCAGGTGGKGTATGGKGGDASLSGIAGASQGGDGGYARSHGGVGGTGGMCAVDQATGGSGGTGGDANSAEGKGGTAQTNGSDGEVQDETGGDGGNGGDGCGPGNGGAGGVGDPNGNPGNPGKKICTEQTSQTTGSTGANIITDTQTSGTTGSGATGSGGAVRVKTIQAINYKGKFLPRSELIIENEEGCGADHWHAAKGVAVATDGSLVADPGPQCGYGKVRNVPLVEVKI